MDAQDKFNYVAYLTSHIHETFPEIGAELAGLQQLDPELFRKALKSPNLARRKGYFLVQIHKALAPFKIPRSRLVGIGWTKLVIIIRYVGTIPIDTLLKLAETNSVYRLQRVLTSDKPVPEKLRYVILTLTPGQHKVFASALKLAGYKSQYKGLSQEEALIRALLASL